MIWNLPWVLYLDFWLWWADSKLFTLAHILDEPLFNVSSLLMELFVSLILEGDFFWILDQLLYFWNVSIGLVVSLSERSIFMFWGWLWLSEGGFRLSNFFIVFYFQILWGFLRLKLLDSGFADNSLRNYFVRRFVVETYFPRMKA